MLGFKSFRSAAVTLAGIEFMHMIRKGQLQTTGEVCPAILLVGSPSYPWVSHLRLEKLRQNHNISMCLTKSNRAIVKTTLFPSCQRRRPGWLAASYGA
jgi:hypothetical protein